MESQRTAAEDSAAKNTSATLSWSRRKVLAACTTVPMTSLAGCFGDDEFEPEVQWNQNRLLSGGVRKSPTVVDGTVYVGGSDRNSYVHALDATDGTIEWSSRTGGSVRPSPQVVDETVYVGNDGGNLYALDAETGDIEWEFETGRNWSSSPTVASGTVFVGDTDSVVYAVDTETGEKEWHFETDDAIYTSPTVLDGTVFIGSNDHRAYALDAETGEKQWEYDTGDLVRAAPTVSNGLVFVGSDNGIVHALDTETGSVEWETETDRTGQNARRFESPTVADETLYIGSYTGDFYAFDTETGEEKWKHETDESSVYPATVVEDRVLFAGWRGEEGIATLFALTTNGTVAWTMEGGPFTGPTVVDGIAFLGIHHEGVVALDIDRSGSSEDTRVTLGTDGHHDEWTGNLEE